MTRHRGRRFSQADLDAAVEHVVAERDQLRAECAALRLKVAGLLSQLADADQHLLQIDADTRRLGREIREFARTVHPSNAGGPEEPRTARAVLRLVEAPSATSDKGEQ